MFVPLLLVALAGTVLAAWGAPVAPPPPASEWRTLGPVPELVPAPELAPPPGPPSARDPEREPALALPPDSPQAPDPPPAPDLRPPPAEAAGPAATSPVGTPAPEPGEGPAGRIPLAAAPPRLAAFAGLSTWVDLYDTGMTPEEQVAVAAAGGVEAMFVQSARFNSPSHLHDAARLGRLVESAHDAGMRVMVWYIPDFADLQRDYRRAQHAMAFVTPRGDRPDAFGLDIETEHVADTAERSRRLLALSGALRTWVGPDYPMAAIVLPPLQLDLRPSWWPDFPYAELTASFDVFVPMSYSSFRGLDAGTTYDWNARNVAELRVRAGDADLPVHLAGGLAADLDEVGAFVAAAGDSAVLGAGLYDLQTTPARTWAALRPLRAGP